MTGNPPALLEDPRSLTALGVPRILRIVNCSRFTKGNSNECLKRSDPYKMGMQMPRHLHSSASKEGAVWPIATRIGWRILGAYGEGEFENH
jgi:hypothetical protein